jgi:hypothetical protein
MATRKPGPSARGCSPRPPKELFTPSEAQLVADFLRRRKDSPEVRNSLLFQRFEALADSMGEKMGRGVPYDAEKSEMSRIAGLVLAEVRRIVSKEMRTET